MTKFEELYNKYQQILEIEDLYKQDDELFALDQELYEYISTKYPEIEDYLENVDNLYDGLKEDEYEYMKDLIKYSMYSKSIVFELTKHPSVDEIIDEYINKNI